MYYIHYTILRLAGVGKGGTHKTLHGDIGKISTRPDSAKAEGSSIAYEPGEG